MIPEATKKCIILELTQVLGGTLIDYKDFTKENMLATITIAKKYQHVRGIFSFIAKNIGCRKQLISERVKNNDDRIFHRKGRPSTLPREYELRLCEYLKGQVAQGTVPSFGWLIAHVKQTAETLGIKSRRVGTRHHIRTMLERHGINVDDVTTTITSSTTPIESSIRNAYIDSLCMPFSLPSSLHLRVKNPPFLDLHTSIMENESTSYFIQPIEYRTNSIESDW